MKVKFKKVHENAVTPEYSTDGAAAVDLVATTERVDIHDNYLEYGTGLALEIPKGFVGKIYPRSSNCKKGILLSNSVGIIDSDYRGELLVRFKNLGTAGVKKYNIGDRIAQLIVEPIEKINFAEAEELSDTERAEGGFGSTGE